MVPEKDVFNLIKSLDSNEKRYFKILLSLQPGGKNYGDLFNAMAAQKEYDEDELTKRFKKQVKDFPSTKRNLYSLVLRALRLYHARSSPEIQLYEMMQNIEVLFRKGLYRECARLIKKTKQKALLHNNLITQLALLNEEAKTISRMDYENVEKDYFEKLMQEQFTLLEEHKITSRVKNVKDRFMHVLLQSGAPKTPSAKNEIDSIMDFDLLENKNLPLNAEILAGITLITYHINITKNYQKSFHYSERMLSQLENTHHHSSELQMQYVNVQILKAISLLKSDGYDECFAVIKKIKNLPIKNAQIESVIFYFSYTVEFHHLNGTGKFDEAVLLVNETEKGLKKYKTTINNNRYMALCYSAAYAFFGNRQYSDAIQWIKKILNDVKTDIRLDFYTCAYLLWIMCHLEKRNFDSALYLSKSTPGFREKNKFLYKIEEAFLGFVIKLITTKSSSKQMREAYKELKVEVDKLLVAPTEKQILAYIDFPAWIDSKIGNLTLQEVMKKRVK